MEKNFYDQASESDIKQYEEIIKLKTGLSEDYTTRCLLDYDIKNHYRVIAVDLSRQKELDADPKAIEKIEFVGQSKNIVNDHNGVNDDGTQNMFVLTI